MKGLKYISWADTTGYAIAAKSYVRALIDAGVNLTWVPMLPGEGLYEAQPVTTWPCPKLASVCNSPVAYDTVLIHTVPEYYPEWIDLERSEGRRILGYTVWELEQLPDHWPEILNRLDGVIVPCRWNLDVFRRSGVTVPIHVVPHLSQFEDSPDPTDADRLALKARVGRELGRQDRFVFYSIGFWSNRKAPYLALEAYWQAFEADDPVLMIVKTSNKDLTRWYRGWRNCFRLRNPSPSMSADRIASRFSNPAPVAVIADESLSDSEMLALHEAGDCFVSLARAEGWGLGAFEAARMGKPVVLTGYGGHLDYLDPELARLVEFSMVPVHEPTWSANYRPTDRWADPSVVEATRHMRAVFEHQQSAREQARRLSERIRLEFSKEAVLNSLLRALE